MGHTPGPWAVYPPEMLDSKNWSVQTDSGMTIVCGDDTQETEANARLIAAAPEMLAALKDLWGWEDVIAEWDKELHGQMRAAIAKAEGGADETPPD